MFKLSMCVVLVLGVLIATMPQAVATTKAAPLTQEEMDHYDKLQAQAAEKNVLEQAGGEDISRTALIVGGIVILTVVVLAIWVW